ncbi:hypothetical protein M409DRAFT_50604 [Zasmidium cellare ATCC 36951]|uniref:Uncharacterized protein n=1 Tax=Zasmidium cellare ATCC 36951 TaxID=1080233 RepID=A0A6A6CZ23_ZASCE|nr:uncharacterized protein M409DRAFT_50604 [Zasmidium cellare ATCC 36951]KAF2172003.1 hypothetical protein M409DRAFT_50604 [Zasmidium cellare ATCC 36951]
MVGFRQFGKQLMAFVDDPRGGWNIATLDSHDWEQYGRHFKLVGKIQLDQGGFEGDVGSFDPIQLQTGETGSASTLELSPVLVSSSRASDASLSEDELDYLNGVMTKYSDEDTSGALTNRRPVHFQVR